MLVLSRQCNQAIWIDDDVEIVVVGVRRGSVQLGITAPTHVRVHREEIHEAIQRGREPPSADHRAKLTRQSGLMAKT
ncbi:MAG: carbon storage regulator CsrA [Planctomycetota bacterium]|jgi:carbon storage regulator